MTMSKGGSQEASSKIRCSSNTLNPDAPEFNPRTKSTGKLNANAPEFVPGQLHNFESVMINMPEIKGYKNGHMPTYTISHQEQCVPVWVPQSYPVNVPIPHFYNNAPIDLISCDFTQTQNYPIQRNVYPTQSHNDYHINTPYNVVAQGKSKLNNKSNKTKQINKDTLSRENNKEHSKDKETVISARDNISVATTKDTTRDITTPIKDVIPEQNKPLTWAERTKLSTKQPPKPTIIPSIQTNITQSSNNNKEIPKDTIKEHKHISKDINKERDKLDKKDKDKLKSNLDLNRDLDEQYDKDIKSKDKKDKDNQIKTYGREYHEQASYAKVFKDAVKSSSSSSSSTSTSTNISIPKESRSEIQTELVKEVIRNTVSTVASSKDITSTISNEVNNKNNISSTSSTSTDVEMITSKDINKEQDKLDIIDTNKDNNNNTSTNVTSSSSSNSSSSSTNNTVVTITSIQQSVDEKSNKDINNEYTVNIMLNYYVYLLKNIKLIDDIRDKYQLPKINFSTTNSTNTQNKSGYKDRERDRDRSDRDRTDRDRDKSDKKDWRHKSYDKNFGNNFRFNNKEFSRASNEFTPTVVASETSWVIKQAKQKNDKEALLRRKIMGLLNRLTFEKFDIIYKQIIECGIDTPEHAEMLVRFVFEKAVTQHHFIPMYVELCAKLAIDLYTIDNSSSTNSTVSSINKITKETNQDKLDVTDTNKDNNNNTSTNVTSSSNNDTSSSSTVVVEQTNELDKNAVEKISDELLNKDTRYSSEDNTDNSTDNNKTNKDDTDDTNNDNNNSTNTNVTSNISSSNNNDTTSSSSSTNSTSLGEDNNNNNNKENMNKYIIKEDNTDKQTSSTYQNTDNILIKTNEYITATSSLEGSSLNQDELIDPKSNRKSDFMRILLNCSQDSFEDNLKPLEIPIELEGDDRFEFEQKYKHKMRGNMIFVGELFKQKLLAAKLLITCLDQVFLKREECILLYDDVNMGNNHLEAMCTLLQTVGRSFDTNRWKHLSEFEKRIQHLEDLGKNEHISFRIRCLIKNVLDSRMERWDKSIYQIQDQPCKLQELRHKHSSSTFNLLTTNNSNSNLNIGSNKDNNNNNKERDKKDKSDKDDKDEVWRMKYRRNKSSNNLVGFGKTDKNKKDISRNKDIYLDNIEIKNNKNIDKDIKSKDKKDNKNKQENNIDNNNKKNKEIKENKQNIENKNKLNDLEEEEDIELYDRDKSDLDDEYEEDDEVDVDEELDDDDEEEYRYNEKLYKNVKSIVSELILSHDIEESNTRVEELNLEKNKLNYFYKLLIINCMEKCSKVNADKESKLITKWIVDLSIQKNTINNLIEGLYEFVFGEDENSMNILIEDYPLLPNTLKLLIDNMNSECNQNQKFKEILTQI